MAHTPLSEAEIVQYHLEGYVIVRGFFEKGEIDLLHREAKEDRDLDKRSFGRADGEGGTVRLSLWNHPGDGIYGMFARCTRIVRSAESLLDGKVYHYHSKMIMKDPRGRGLDVASGLRLLVSKRCAVPSVDECFHCR